MPSCGVCPSVTFVNSVEANKHIFNFFFIVRCPHHSSFPYQTSSQYSHGASNADVVGTDRHASVNLVYHNQHGRQDEEKRTERNLIVCSDKSEANVANNRRLRSINDYINALNVLYTIEANY